MSQHFFEKLITNGLFKEFTVAQMETINAVLNECAKQGATIQQSAYIFATAYHECFNPRHPGTRLTPIVEFGGEKYLRSKKYYPYYGRGLSQLTWIDNYKKEAARLKIDLVNKPELILHIPTAANSHVYCMLKGVYTGRKLSDYIGHGKCDYMNARRIVNGMDRASLIAEYAKRFEEALA